jgi:addiction module RelE/StbE family toxin
MDFLIDPKLQARIRKIKSKDKKLAEKIEKQLDYFHQNHQHPSLRTHKLTGNLRTYWSISIDRSMRLLYLIEGELAVFFDIGTHDEVYKK